MGLRNSNLYVQDPQKETLSPRQNLHPISSTTIEKPDFSMEGSGPIFDLSREGSSMKNSAATSLNGTQNITKDIIVNSKTLSNNIYEDCTLPNIIDNNQNTSKEALENTATEYKTALKEYKAIKKQIAIQKSRIFPIITLLVFIATLVGNSYTRGKIGEISDKYNILISPENNVFIVWIVLYCGLCIVFIWQIFSGSFFFNTNHTIIFNVLNWFSLPLNCLWLWAFTTLGARSIKRYDVSDRIYYTSDYIEKYLSSTARERFDSAPVVQFSILLALFGFTTAQYHYLMTFSHNLLVKFLYGLYYSWIMVALALSFTVFYKYMFWSFMDDQAHIGLYVMVISILTLLNVFISYRYMNTSISVIGLVYLSTMLAKIKATGGFLAVQDVTIVMIVFDAITCFFVLFFNIQSFINGLKSFKSDTSKNTEPKLSEGLETNMKSMMDIPTKIKTINSNN